MSVIIKANYEDRPKFLEIWMEFMKEERKGGSYIHTTTKNLLNYVGYFDAYTMGQMFGACLFWMPQPGDTPKGVIMVGEGIKIGEWDTDRPECAILWGVYVYPEFRGSNIGLELEQAACPEALKLGFHHVETTVRLANKGGERVALAFGTKAESELHVADLRERMKELSHG